MPTVTITWDDINDNEDGFNIYRDTVPLDTANPENLPAPLDTVAAGIGTYDDTTAAEDTTYYYAVAAVKGTFVNAAAGVQVDTAAAPGDDFSTAQPGDPVTGGYYVGVRTYADARQFHLIVADASHEVYNQYSWGYSGTVTGADDPDDGVANASVISGLGGSALFDYHANLDVGGVDDYYLASNNDLNLIYANLASLAAWQPGAGGAQELAGSGYVYISSTEYSDNTVVGVKMDTGDDVQNVLKSAAYYNSRPVRRVPV